MKVTKARLACGSQRKDEREEAQVETRKGQIEYKETPFHHEDYQASEQVAQRGCAGSVPLGFQNQTE